jgi:glucose-1-phosphate adenylyltransferase
MKQMMGVIHLMQEHEQLGALTMHRNLAAVPFGGRYRLVDFVLSNMVNSGIEDVAVFMEHKVRPLLDHLGSGKEWDLDRKRGGLFMLPAEHEGAHGQTVGDVHTFYTHRDFFHRGTQEYVFIARTAHVCNMDLRRVLLEHQRSEAQITAVYRTIVAPDAHISYVLDAQGRIVRLDSHQSGICNVPMDMYVMRKSVLLDLIDTARAQGHRQLIADGVFAQLSHVHVHGYKYDGYVAQVDTIAAYYQHSMELLQPEVLRELFFRGAPIYTKVKDEPPTKYCHTARVHNALIANGCVINGTVENSILFRGVRIHAGAVVRNSIVMQNGEIGENVIIENAILDKDVFVDHEQHLCGIGQTPYVASKRKVV